MEVIADTPPRQALKGDRNDASVESEGCFSVRSATARTHGRTDAQTHRHTDARTPVEERIEAERWRFPAHHVHRAEDVAVVVAGLQVLGDVRKRAQVLRVLGRARDVADFVLGDDVLRRSERKLEV